MKDATRLLERRSALIDKGFAEGLTDVEAKELDAIDREVSMSEPSDAYREAIAMLKKRLAEEP